VRILIVLLPFTTVITVVWKMRIDVPFIWFYKELLVLILFISFIWNILQKKITIKLDILDWVLAAYIINLLIVSTFTTGISGIVFWWRYDFSFLIVFWIIYHGAWLLKENFSYYIKLALGSCGVMLGIGILLKYPFSEDLLLYLGFSWNPSAWEFSWVPPIFHGIDWANVRRFQWILDGPNTMWAFLILIIGLFSYYFRGFKSWYFMNGWIILILIALIFYTYSRSAILWVWFGIAIVLLSSLSYIFKRYKKEFFSIALIFMVLLWFTYIQYSDKVDAIIWRAWSTKGHFERMEVGIERVKSSPFWQWLGSAWPGYRFVQKLETIDRQAREEKDRFYIPESWYIQQFIEWWIVWWVCFIILMLLLFMKLWKKHIFLGWMFAGIAIMNIFLHTFESSPFSLLLFSLVGIILWSPIYGKRSK
jgi:hypothetical protein